MPDMSELGSIMMRGSSFSEILSFSASRLKKLLDVLGLSRSSWIFSGLTYSFSLLIVKSMTLFSFAVAVLTALTSFTGLSTRIPFVFLVASGVSISRLRVITGGLLFLLLERDLSWRLGLV